MNDKTDITLSETAFSTLNLKKSLLSNLQSLEYNEMTPIQAQSLPHILGKKDLIAQGKTGSGKTAAFGLGILEHLDVKRYRIQSLVLCPTRELADQVATEIRRLARSIHNIKVLTLCGGMPYGPQIGSIEHGAHIIVGTPGRIEDHMRKGRLDMSELNTLVLDEADKMLEMGFQEVLDKIIGFTPKSRQTLLFSATFPKEINAISERIMKFPERVIAESPKEKSTIIQHFYTIEKTPRLKALQLVLMQYKPISCVIFCTTKLETQEIADDLANFGFSATALHGDLDQKQRSQTLIRFSNNSVSILVATDVASRGLDIDNLDLVINFHVTRDTEVHVHRIGRTGRAGKNGVACTLYNEKERRKLDDLEKYMNISIELEELPTDDLLNAPKFYPEMSTIQIDAGKKQKVRAGDILGALTGKNGISGQDVGKITVIDMYSYVAVNKNALQLALKKLNNGTIKKRSFRIRKL